MGSTGGEATATRVPLSRRRVLHAAMELADSQGLGGVTMRAVAGRLDVEAMSLYHHVANKEALLDGLAELVVDECHAEVGARDLPDPSQDWQGALRARVLAARSVMLRHPWAPAVLETRTTMPTPVVTWFDALLGTLRSGGFSWELAHHAMHAIGGLGLGFVHELFQPTPGDDAAVDVDAMVGLAPNIGAMLAAVVHDDGPDLTLGWCDDQTEFAFSLDVLLDGLALRLDG